MTLPVAIPLRFGSRRFGRVQGSKLQTDGKDYPQPSGPGVWQYGQTIRVAPPGTDPAVEEYGYKTDALLSGGGQQLYGKDINGWIFCDAVNGVRWLIQPDLAGADTTFANPLAINFLIVKFGIFDGNPPLSKTARTATLASWGQSSPPISLASGDSCPELYDPPIYEPTLVDCDLHLVSAKTDGSVAVLMASIACNLEPHQGNAQLPDLHQWPIGFIGVTCTSDPKGNPPTLSLSVLRDRATTLGIRSSFTITGGLVPRQLCAYYNDVSEGTEDFTQGISNEILALWYENDVLTEMVINCTIEGHTVCDTAVFEGIVGGTNSYSQHSEGDLSVTWELSIGTTKKAGWTYRLAEVMDATIVCGTSLVWTKDVNETLSDGTDIFQSYIGTASGSDYISPLPTLPHVEAESGAFSFAQNAACRSASDIWEDFFGFEGNDLWYSMEIIRYAYNVIGVSCRGDVRINGPALAPSGKIAGPDVGTGNYGAYNSRTGEAVAGVAVPVGYV